MLGVRNSSELHVVTCYIICSYRWGKTIFKRFKSVLSLRTPRRMPDTLIWAWINSCRQERGRYNKTKADLCDSFIIKYQLEVNVYFCDMTCFCINNLNNGNLIMLPQHFSITTVIRAVNYEFIAHMQAYHFLLHFPGNTFASSLQEWSHRYGETSRLRGESRHRTPWQAWTQQPRLCHRQRARVRTQSYINHLTRLPFILPLSLSHSLTLSLSLSLSLSLYVHQYIYSASQKKRNRELSMFYHNLITIIVNKWHIFGKLRSSSFIWCNSYDSYLTHEWLKAIWREETKKSFGGWYLNFKRKITFLESSISALSNDTSIRKNEPGITKFCLFKVRLAFP